MKGRNSGRSRFSGMRLLPLCLCLSWLAFCELIGLAGRTAPDDSEIVSVAYKSIDGGATWVPVSNGLAVYHVGSLAIDHHSPGTVYAGTDRGVFKTTDGGNRWVQPNGLITLFNINDLIIDPVNPSTVYAAGSAVGGGAILKSADAGLSWKVIGTGLRVSSLGSLLIDPENPALLYARGIFQAYKSTDGGNTWHSVLTLGPAGDVIFPSDLKLCPSNPAILYAIGSDHIYKTVNGGNSWSDITERWRLPSASANPVSIAVDPTDAAIVYIPDEQGNVRKSTDGGQTWMLIPRNSPSTIRGLIIDPATPTTLYATGDNTLLKSTDSGNTWAATALPAAFITGLAIDPTNFSIFYAGGYGELRSADAPWISHCIIDGKKLFVGGQFFDKGAVILLDGEAQPTKPDPSSPNEILIGKKAGKIIRKKPDTRIQIRNANGKLSQEVPIWPPLQ